MLTHARWTKTQARNAAFCTTHGIKLKVVLPNHATIPVLINSSLKMDFLDTLIVHS